MRIVLLSAEYWPTPGGVGDYTQRLGAALALTGEQIAVWTLRDDRLVALDPTDSAEQHVDIVGLANWRWSGWRAIISAVQRVQPDIVHIQYQTGAYGMHPAINLLPWRLGRLSKRPRLVVTAHDLLLPYLFPKAGFVRNWVTRYLFEASDATIVTNPDDLAQLTGQQRAPLVHGHQSGSLPRYAGRVTTRVHLIPIGSNIAVHPPAGYDRSTWRATLGVGPQDILVAFFGLISPSKGLDVLLDALLDLPERFRLLIVGGEAPAAYDRAYAAALRARIDGPALRGRVIITGQCPEQDVSAHLLASDLAALPFVDGASFRRGSLLAALAHGLAVVTTTGDRPDEPDRQHDTAQSSLGSYTSRLSTLPDLIDQQNVALVGINDASALAARLQQLGDDLPLRKRLGTAGRALAQAFTWEAIAARHQDLYRDLQRGS